MSRLHAGAAALLTLVLAACGGGPDDPPSAVAAEQAQPPRRQALSATRPLSTTELLDFAERQYPDLFPGHQADVTLPPYVYRHYPTVGNYVGVANGRVLVFGPVSGGKMLDVGSMVGFRCQVLPQECQPNPLLSAPWSTGLLVEPDADARALAALAMDADGQATAVVKDRGSLARLWATRTLPPGADGVRRWSTPLPLDAIADAAGGYATSEPVLLVAANGTAVVLWESGGYLMASRWTPANSAWSAAARLVDAPGYAINGGLPAKYGNDNLTFDFATGLRLRPVIDPAGNVALLFARTGVAGGTVRQVVHWAAGSARATVHELPVQNVTQAIVGVAGSALVVAAGLNRDGAADVVVWRGTAAAGMGAEEALERRSNPANLHNLLVGPTGRVVVVWDQNDGVRDTTFIADASSPTSPFEVSDQGPGFSSKVLLLTDLGDLHSYGFGLVSGRCDFRRQVDGVWLPSILIGPCPMEHRAWTANSRGDLLGADSNGLWTAFDARTGRVRTSSYVTVVPMSAALDVRVALSSKGQAVLAATAPYTRLPSPTLQSGTTGSVNHVWGWLLR